MCLNCKPGEYMPSEFSAASCLPCPAGTYSESYRASSCNSCLKGKYSDKVASTSCITCPIGSFCPTDRSSNLQICPVGTFQPLPGAEKCVSCPTGSKSPPGKCISNSDLGSGSCFVESANHPYNGNADENIDYSCELDGYTGLYSFYYDERSKIDTNDILSIIDNEGDVFDFNKAPISFVYKWKKGVIMRFQAKSGNPNKFWGFRLMIKPEPNEKEFQFFLNLRIGSRIVRLLSSTFDSNELDTNRMLIGSTSSSSRSNSIVNAIINDPIISEAFEDTVFRLLNLSPESR